MEPSQAEMRQAWKRLQELEKFPFVLKEKPDVK